MSRLVWREETERDEREEDRFLPCGTYEPGLFLQGYKVVSNGLVPRSTDCAVENSTEVHPWRYMNESVVLLCHYWYIYQKIEKGGVVNSLGLGLTDE